MWSLKPARVSARGLCFTARRPLRLGPWRTTPRWPRPSGCAQSTGRLTASCAANLRWGCTSHQRGMRDSWNTFNVRHGTSLRRPMATELLMPLSLGFPKRSSALTILPQNGATLATSKLAPLDGGASVVAGALTGGTWIHRRTIAAPATEITLRHPRPLRPRATLRSLRQRRATRSAVPRLPGGRCAQHSLPSEPSCWERLTKSRGLTLRGHGPTRRPNLSPLFALGGT